MGKCKNKSNVFFFFFFAFGNWLSWSILSLCIVHSIMRLRLFNIMTNHDLSPHRPLIVRVCWFVVYFRIPNRINQMLFTQCWSFEWKMRPDEVEEMEFCMSKKKRINLFYNVRPDGFRRFIENWILYSFFRPFRHDDEQRTKNLFFISFFVLHFSSLILLTWIDSLARPQTRNSCSAEIKYVRRKKK